MLNVVHEITLYDKNCKIATFYFCNNMVSDGIQYHKIKKELVRMNKQYCNGFVHVIKAGDSLYLLSRKYRVPLALILRANPYVDVYNLQIGQEICIPITRPFPPPMHRNMPGNRLEEEEMDRMEEEMETPKDREEGDGEVVSSETERDVYITDGEKSLGDILQEFGTDWTEFAENNDLSQVLLADDVVLYFPKKV